MNVQRQIGTALAAAISAHEFAGAIESVTATYRRRPDYRLDQIGSLVVSVSPGPVAVGNQTATRGSDFFDLTFGVVLAKSVASEADIEQLEDLNQELIDALRSHQFPLADVPPGVEYRELTQVMPFDAATLEERSVFLSQIEVAYTVPLDKVT